MTKTWNDKFNEDLQRYIDGEIDDAFIYKLGMPSEILKSTGFPEREMQMAASRLAEKARDHKHPYDLQDIKGFVDALNDPIAVFKYKNINEGRNIIIQLIHKGKRFLAGVHIDKEINETSVTDIRNLFPKDTIKWLNWIQQGKSIYLNKKEVQAIIAEQRTNHAEVSYVDLDFVAKIVEKFENPKFLHEKVQNQNDIFEDFDDYEIKAVGDGIQTASKDMDNKYSEEMQEAKAKLFDTIMEAKKDLGDEISIAPTEISENGDKHVISEILPDFESPFEDQNIIGGVSHLGDEDCVHNLALCLENVNDADALGKAVHEAHVKHLEQFAKQAIHDRIVTPSARVFTPEQVGVLNRYHQVATPDTPVSEAFSRLLDEVAQEPDVARKPEKWVTDTAKELDEVAQGITRDEARDLHI